jgi:hypothetical protein
MSRTAGPVEPDRVTRVAPFGVRFWDPVMSAPVGPGLVVTARPSAGGRAVTAVPGPAGAFVLRGLPGLSEWERGAGDEPFWQQVPDPTPYRVEVRDPAGRFLPLAFDAELPVRGLVTSACAAPAVPVPLPAAQARVVPLFSAPGRPVPPGAAVVRAHLVARVNPATEPEPAAWALLIGTLPGAAPRTTLGVADADGRVTLLVPHPEIPDAALGGEPAGEAPLVRLSDQTWPLDLAARFGGADPPVATDDIPDLCRLLDQRPADLIADDTAAPRTPLTQTALRYGRETVLRTAARSTLLLTSTA